MEINARPNRPMEQTARRAALCPPQLIEVPLATGVFVQTLDRAEYSRDTCR
jgi:hypothetical protein